MDPIDYMAVTRNKPDLADQLDKAKTDFVGYKKQIEDMREAVGTFEVDSDGSAMELTGMASQAKALVKQLEQKRKAYISDPDHFVRSLNAFVKTYRDILEDLIDTAKNKIARYQYQLELKRRKAEKRAQEQQAQLQAKMDAEAKEFGVQAPKLPDMVMPHNQAPIRTAAGSASLQTVWDYDVVNLGEVPPEYIMVDDRKVKAAIKAGIRQISGLKIKEVPKTILRTVA